MMKALITFAAAVAVFGGISSASAQNTAPTTKSAISPSRTKVIKRAWHQAVRLDRP
jgi:hypothetical protein